MSYSIRLRRGTAAEWSAANPVLGLGEVGLESQTGGGFKIKAGDGTNAWDDLPYSPPSAAAWYEQSGEPASPAPGDRWLDTDTAILYTRIDNDGNPTWIE